MSQPNEIDIYDAIKLKSEKFNKSIAMFPNLVWDGALAERDTVFKGLDDWIIKTIEYCREKNYLLILREHPQKPTLL